MTTKTNVTVNPAELQTPVYQRSVNERRVAKIANDFDPNALGAITIVKRPDGSRWVVDGRHRGNAAIRNGLTEMYAIQYEGLTVAQEAQLFLDLNDMKLVSAIDKHRASVYAEVPEAVAVEQVITSHGWRVAQGHEDGSISAIGSVYSVCKGLGIAGANAGPKLLDKVLTVITGAWGHNRDASHELILRGIGKVIARYEGDIDLQLLTKKLSKVTPTNLAAEGRARAAALTVNKDVGVAGRIVQIYNASRSAGRIADWTWSR